MRRRQSILRFGSLLYCTGHRRLAVSAFFSSVAGGGKVAGNRYPCSLSFCGTRPGPRDWGLHRAAKKSDKKGTDPNHPAGFHRTVHRLQGCSASGKIRPDTGERPLQAYPAAQVRLPHGGLVTSNRHCPSGKAFECLSIIPHSTAWRVKPPVFHSATGTDGSSYWAC